MLLKPQHLVDDLDRLEAIEKATLRLVVQAIYDYRETATEIFQEESDWVADIGEDITREAMDAMGVARISQRLFGKIDYKRARYLFHPDYAIRQALFVDSKAEKVSGQRTATLQTSQLSMRVRQIRAGKAVDVAGSLPPILPVNETDYVTTTIFVKYNYQTMADSNQLQSMIVAAVPNGLLQRRYNPSAEDTIWLVGRNAPSRGEAFRVRLSFARLRKKASWRVQTIPLSPTEFVWQG